ncbi:phage tail protein, partial [Salmonella enterica]|nr:phage tail protein [Salmonella enterica]EBP3691607.1 phage tail protein [Salmonella enterica subsp. enterica]EAT6877892.1 phage tail protein [Salmonella enterica]EBP0004311.1 phage tail protein [Salmonella enterica]EBT1684117.1 phage tail protein [Salmonella enterica]
AGQEVELPEQQKKKQREMIQLWS